MKYNVYLYIYDGPTMKNRQFNNEESAKAFCEVQNANQGDIGAFFYLSEKDEILDRLKEEAYAVDDLNVIPYFDGITVVSKNHAGDIACHSGTNFQYETCGTMADFNGTTTHKSAIDAIRALIATPKDWIYQND